MIEIQVDQTRQYSITSAKIRVDSAQVVVLKRRSRAIIVATILCMFSPSALSQQRSLLGTSNPSPKAMPATTNGLPALSEEAIIVARSLGIMDNLQLLQRSGPGQRASSPTVESLALRQDTIESILQSALEVRTVAARIDREMANANEVLAYFAERRDRAVRLNTYADLISGGITGILSGSFKVAEMRGVTPDLIDTIEGSLQTGLSAWALQQQSGEKRREQAVPSLLTHLFQQKANAEHDYPPSVWAYLSSPLPASKTNASRLDIVVDRWMKLELCLSHGGHRADTTDRAKRVAGHLDSRKITIDVLEDRIAMLSDLRATVVQMDSDLLEMMQIVKGKRMVAAH